MKDVYDIEVEICRKMEVLCSKTEARGISSLVNDSVFREMYLRVEGRVRHQIGNKISGAIARHRDSRFGAEPYGKHS